MKRHPSFFRIGTRCLLTLSVLGWVELLHRAPKITLLVGLLLYLGAIVPLILRIGRLLKRHHQEHS
jgi:hypothetical protein